jgi:hypothetical protein
VEAALQLIEGLLKKQAFLISRPPLTGLCLHKLSQIIDSEKYGDFVYNQIV